MYFFSKNITTAQNRDSSITESPYQAIKITTNEAFKELLTFNDKEIHVIKKIKQSISEKLEIDREYANNLKKKAQLSKSKILNEFIIEKAFKLE